MATTKSFWTPELHSGASYYKGNNMEYDPNISSSYDLNKSSSFGTGKISFGEGIDYDDLDISYRYVNVPLTKILPLLWNMKAWDAKCEYSFFVSDSRDYLDGNYESPASTTFSFNNKINGTYSGIINYIFRGNDISDIYTMASIPKSEPFNKVGGYDAITSTIIGSTTFNSTSIVSSPKIKSGSLLPSIYENSFYPFYYGDYDNFGMLENFNIIKTHNTDFGSCGIDLYGQLYNIADFFSDYFEQGFGHFVQLQFNDIIIKDDGTADVAFDLYVDIILGGANTNLDEVSTEYVERQSSFFLWGKEYYDDITTYTQVITSNNNVDFSNTVRSSTGLLSSMPTTISILGVEKQVYLGVNEFIRVYGDADMSYNLFDLSDYQFNFSFSYDIDVSEFWEYE